MKYLLAIIMSLGLFSCAINDPVKTQAVVDDRPRLTFDVSDYEPSSVELIVDGLSYGKVNKYLSDIASLRILPGKHEVKLVSASRIIYQKTDYFAESTLTTIKVTQYED